MMTSTTSPQLSSFAVYYGTLLPTPATFANCFSSRAAARAMHHLAPTHTPCASRSRSTATSQVETVLKTKLCLRRPSQEETVQTRCLLLRCAPLPDAPRCPTTRPHDHKMQQRAPQHPLPSATSGSTHPA
eukprot:4759142-Pyramimonas_sp.AAC.1